MIPLEVLALLLPAVGALLPWLFRRDPKLQDASTLIITVLLLITVIQLVLADETSRITLGSITPTLEFALQVDSLGLLFALVASGLWILNSIYSLGYMHGVYGPRFEGEQRYWSCFSLAIVAAIGIAFSANLLTLFLFYELMTFSTWPLVTHSRSDEAKRSGRIYLGILLGSSTLFLLSAIIWTWVLTGTLEFEAGGFLAGSATPGQVSILILLFCFGSAKCAIFPLHQWLPNAMVAPTPVSALLHAVAVVKAGVFTVLKISTSVIGADLMMSSWGAEVVAWTAAATILFASLVALTRQQLKARLAYSTIGQLNYIVLGAVVAFPAAIEGAALHIAMHAFGKITLFFAAGAIFVASGKTRIDQLAGIGKRMPWTMSAFLIGTLSVLGLPPLCGMWSKWLLAEGMIAAHQWAFLGALIVSSLLSIAYLIPISVQAFFASEPDDASPHGEAPWACRIPLLISAAACLLLFWWPGIFAQLAGMVR